MILFSPSTGIVCAIMMSFTEQVFVTDHALHFTVLLCRGKAEDGKQRPWVVPFLRTPWTHCKVCWQEKSSFFSTQPASPLCSPFCSGACLWLPETMELPSYILKGAFEESTSVQLFHPVCAPLPIYIWVSISASFAHSLCLYHSKKSTFAFHYSISVFFPLIYTCPLWCWPPPSFLTALCFKILSFTSFCLLFLD